MDMDKKDAKAACKNSKEGKRICDTRSANKRPRLSHNDLECPICMEVRRGKIFICVNGHDVCETCMAKMKPECPKCKGNYNNPPTRNLRLEALIERNALFDCDNKGCEFRGVGEALREHETTECGHRRIPCLLESCGRIVKAKDLNQHMEETHKECKYVEEGCKIDGTQDMVTEHEMTCPQRMVPCPCGYCDDQIKFVNVLDHLKQAHKVVPTKHNSDTYCTFWTLKDERLLKTSKEIVNWIPYVHLYDNQHFVGNFQRSSEGEFYSWVHILGDQKLADMFNVVIKSYGNGAEHKKLCKVHPVDTEDKLVLSDLDCFEISGKQVKQCMDSNINNLTEEQRNLGYASRIAFEFCFKKN